LWFQKKRWKCEIPIGSNVKLSRVMAAILNFRSAYQICVFGAELKSNMAARVHNVFSLAEILKIFLSESTKSIELWLCRNETKILYMTIQWTFLPSLIQICFVVSEKKMKMWNSHRIQC
jgi:hypothetical protein